MKKREVFVFSVCFLAMCAVLIQPITTHAQLTYTIISGNYRGIPYDLVTPNGISKLFPLVILAGGIGGDKSYLTSWYDTLTRGGYAVLGFSTKPEDLAHVATYAFDCKNNIKTLLPYVFNASAFPIMINQNEVSMVGISGGSDPVLSFNDSRIKTIVVISPYHYTSSSNQNICPVLIICGQNDTIAPYSIHGLTFYEEIEPPKMILELVGATHASNNGGNYIIPWLNLFVKGNTTERYFVLNSVGYDPGVSRYLADFSTPPNSPSPSDTILPLPSIMPIQIPLISSTPKPTSSVSPPNSASPVISVPPTISPYDPSRPNGLAGYVAIVVIAIVLIGAAIAFAIKRKQIISKLNS
jgi:hypothetical protein